MNKILHINPDYPEADLIQEAAKVIKAGGVAVFPTTGLYGIGVDAFNSSAIEKIFYIKKRPVNKPILILIDDEINWQELVKSVPESASRLIKSFWPGDITLVFEASDTLPLYLTSGTGKIGIRMTAHKVAHSLIKALGKPLTGTSANISGNSGCSRVEDLESSIVNQVDVILDAGPLNAGTCSTVVDVTVDPPRILRPGRILNLTS